MYLVGLRIYITKMIHGPYSVKLMQDVFHFVAGHWGQWLASTLSKYPALWRARNSPSKWRGKKTTTQWKWQATSTRGGKWWVALLVNRSVFSICSEMNGDVEWQKKVRDCYLEHLKERSLKAWSINCDSVKYVVRYGLTVWQDGPQHRWLRRSGISSSNKMI